MKAALSRNGNSRSLAEDNNYPFQQLDSMPAVVSFHAQHKPDAHLFMFLHEANEEPEKMSCGDLDRRARNVAAALRSAGAYGERVLLSFPTGPEFIAAFFGCLYAGAIAVPTASVRGRRGQAAFGAIARDSSPRLILSPAAAVENLEALADETGVQATVTDLHSLCGDIDSMPVMTPPVRADDMAFLQYTSGSTSAPKGVMVTHANLMHNQRTIRRQLGHTNAMIAVSWLPIFHDMGLVGLVMQPAFLGRPAYFMSPTRFLQEPASWLQAISHYRATTSGAPNFAYDTCVDRISPEQCADLDLSSLDVLFCGSEPVRAATLERFSKTFARHGFRAKAFFPCYGLAEATLFVSGGPHKEHPVVWRVSACDLEKNTITRLSRDVEDCQELVGCGEVMPDQRVIAVDPETRIPLPEGIIGELWISGPSVTSGYFQNAEATSETFGAYTADTGDGPFLRSGDLGFVAEGQVFVTGRIKDLLIIRGRNHYPHDIEKTAEKSHSALVSGASAAFLTAHKAQQQLVLVHEVRRDHLRTVTPKDVLRAVRSAVSRHHGLFVADVFLVKTASVPKTTSGKIRRDACRQAYEGDTLTAFIIG